MIGTKVVIPFLAVVAIAIAISLMVITVLGLAGKYELSPGQVWVYDACKRDPFREPCPDKNEVIAVKDGYVKYRNLETGEENSEGIRWFLIGSELSAEGKP